MNNKLLDRLYRIYPFSNNMVNRNYYRNVRVKQLANLLHRLSWDDEEISRSLEMIRYIEELGVSNFTLLCNLVATKRMGEFVEFLIKITKEKI